MVFEYIINLELLLFRLKSKELAKCVALQLDSISLLTN